MAYIDKIYVKTKAQAEEFKEWCRHQFVTDKYGKTVSLHRWCNEKNVIDSFDWSSGEKPVFSATWDLDYYIIKNCPFDYIQDRLKIMYGEDTYNGIKNGTYDPVAERPKSCVGPGYHYNIFPVETFDNHLFNKPVANCFHISIYKNHITENSDYLQFVGYNHNWCSHSIYDKNGEVKKRYRVKEQIGTWDSLFDFVIADSHSEDCCDCKSIKALTRRIRKWGLPIGTVLIVEDPKYKITYKVVIKK